jgi:D-alanine-D-alanine ligase
MPRLPKPKAAILHAAIPPSAAADEQDTLLQVAAIAASLDRLGWQAVAVPVTLDLAALARRLRALKPDFAFNLVESLDGTGQLIHLAPAVLDRLGLPYSGAGSSAMFLTSNKPMAKRRLVAAGMPTAGWVDDAGEHSGGDHGPVDPAGRFIVKSVWEDASIGIEPGSVVEGLAAARRRIAEMHARHGGQWFAEAFIDGREFNVALLESDTGVDTLPVAEILFLDFPPDRPRILDYASKWEEESFAYTHTPRSFDLSTVAPGLVEEMRQLAIACWREFELGGYARVDFRVDAAGRVHVLEINANPCLTPEAGFHAMLDEAGIDFDRAVERIVAPCLGIEQAARRRAV